MEQEKLFNHIHSQINVYETDYKNCNLQCLKIKKGSNNIIIYFDKHLMYYCESTVSKMYIQQIIFPELCSYNELYGCMVMKGEVCMAACKEYFLKATQTKNVMDLVEAIKKIKYVKPKHHTDSIMPLIEYTSIVIDTCPLPACFNRIKHEWTDEEYEVRYYYL